MPAELVRALWWLAAAPFALLMPLLLSAKEPRATIEDTGSTNRPGLSVSFDATGKATVESRTGDTRQLKLDVSMCQQFMRDLEAAGPLADLPVVHCMKSASFGSSLFIEFKGVRSPDLSCPTQAPRSQELQKQAHQLLQAAREGAGIPARGVRR